MVLEGDSVVSSVWLVTASAFIRGGGGGVGFGGAVVGAAVVGEAVTGAAVGAAVVGEAVIGAAVGAAVGAMQTSPKFVQD